MKTKSIAAAVAALTMTAMAAVPVYASAAGTTYSTTRAEGSVDSTTLDKYLVMDADANVPNAKFTFSVAQGNAITADKTNGKLAVLKGVGTPALTNGTMAFSTDDTDAAIAEAAAGTGSNTDTPVFVTTGEGKTTDEKYVKKTLTLDFSSVAFTEPGVYRYIITEAGTNQGITNGYTGADSDTVTTRTLDVYVEDAGTTDTNGKPQLKIAGYVMYNGTQTTAPKAAATNEGETPNGAEVAGATKNATITNVYASQDLTFGKVVTGNQGSKDKYFDFTVTISNAVPKTKYTVDISNADPTSGENAATIDDNKSKENVTTITVPAAAGEATTSSVTTHFYLQNGQYITIKGLAKNTGYSVSENAEDYTSKAANLILDNNNDVKGFTISDVTFKDAAEGTIAAEDIETGFTNDRSGTIPTGIINTVAGSAGILAVGIAGVAGGMFYLKKKKNEDE